MKTFRQHLAESTQSIDVSKYRVPDATNPLTPQGTLSPGYKISSDNKVIFKESRADDAALTKYGTVVFNCTSPRFKSQAKDQVATLQFRSTHWYIYPVLPSDIQKHGSAALKSVYRWYASPWGRNISKDGASHVPLGRWSGNELCKLNVRTGYVTTLDHRKVLEAMVDKLPAEIPRTDVLASVSVQASDIRRSLVNDTDVLIWNDKGSRLLYITVYDKDLWPQSF